jgi:hypothetical protein
MSQKLWISNAGAVVDGPYRYSLWREWDPDRPRLLWVLLNPSTADANREDPTLRRCLAFSRTWSFGSLEIVNLYAWRSPTPEDLTRVENPVGDQNDRYIQEAVQRAAKIVVAWGAYKALHGRDRAVIDLLAQPLWCLGKTRDGNPRHPLYLKADTPLCPFQPAHHPRSE